MTRFFRSSSLICVAGAIFLSASLALAGADLRFDVATEDANFGDTLWGYLNFETTNGHYLCQSSDGMRDDINDAGNSISFYYNDLETDWESGDFNGDQEADNIVDYWYSGSTTDVPQYVVLNELNQANWENNPSKNFNGNVVTYRNWLIGCVTRLNSLYTESVVLFIADGERNPTGNASAWVSLSNHCYFAIEGYLSGSLVKSHGFSVSWCQSQYQSYINSFHALGVPDSKLFLAEHYGQTTAASGDNFGRTGLSHDDWITAIQARCTAIHNISPKGYISYGWQNNDMNSPDSSRIDFENAYAAKTLP
jgi:hypothetical protein